ncbi:MAG: hypothetical protein SGI92_27810 [Bryobacteraceae bacterium]|nr:hypothetical protein [Bryobacteraceae bacterium]
MNQDSPEVPFCRPARKPRYLTRENCAQQSPELPIAPILWSAKVHSLIRQTAPKPSKEATINKPKKESWRSTPSLPGGTPKEPKPSRPSAEFPDLRPTRDRILFPWEAELTDIEWAVINFLQKKHPDVFEELVKVALDHSGLIGDPK